MAYGVYFVLGIANWLLKLLDRGLRRGMNRPPAGEPTLAELRRRDREQVLHDRLHGLSG